jgi:tetratricopeptide (TPR) repeat protein
MPSVHQLLQRATTAHRAGRFAEAEKTYLLALRQDAKNPDIFRLLGALYVQMWRSAEAERNLRAALTLQPRNHETLTNLGLALRNQGRLTEAAACYTQALGLKPDYRQAIFNLGLTWQQLGLTDEALPLLRQAVEANPADPTARCCLANLLRQLGRPGEAISQYEEVLRLKPDQAEARSNLGLAYFDDQQFEQAVDWYQRALGLAPDDVKILNNFGYILLSVGRTEEAQALLARAVATKPDYAQAQLNLGAALRGLGQLDAAEAAYERARVLAPTMAEAEVNLGVLKQDLMRHEEAIRHFDQALAMRPDLTEAAWNKALSLLALGRFEQGWTLYESGLGLRHLRGADLPEATRWDGSTQPGKRLLLRAEQGLGDSIQFIRYARVLKERDFETVVCCPPSLTRLFAACPDIDTVVASPQETTYDQHVPMLSLPFALRTTLESIPDEVPYLFVSPVARARLASRFQGVPRPRVGLVWAGNPRSHHALAHLLDRRRSLTLASLLPLFSHTDITFYSLQKDDRTDEIRSLGLTDRLIDLMPEVEDFMDTAAIIAQLDLVISVDTAVVHLAGALAKPVWVLSRFDACWRWLGNRETSPWYPTARVFGQPEPGDWATVVARVSAALANWVQAPAGR